MQIETKEYEFNNHKLVFRTALKDDAKTLLPYLKRVCGETRFLSREADECIDLTIKDEENFILSHLESKNACLILAELDGKFIGNASFDCAGRSRRNAHRASIGIALYKDYTGQGIGKKLFALVLETIEKCGYESAELTVVEGNNLAINLYKSFGFIEIGRIPHAFKYDDGTYADDIFMMKNLKKE